MVPVAVERVLVDLGLAAPAATWTAQTGGRTNRVWKIEGKGSALICKLFGKPDENPLYPNQPGAEYEALKALYRHRIVPEPVALVNTDVGEVLIYRHLDGAPWQTGAGKVAHLLATLHGMQPDLPLRRLPSGSAALIEQTKAIIAATGSMAPTLPITLDDPKVPPVQKEVLIHTDVVANNILVTRDGLRLIDWQCPALGDPCEDLASFLSPAMQTLYAENPLDPAEARAFLAAYPNRSTVQRYLQLAPIFHWRIAAYCHWKSARGERDYEGAMELEISALQNSYGDHKEARQ